MLLKFGTFCFTDDHEMDSSDSSESARVIQRVRNWKFFPGRNKFYCNGRFMTSPDNSIFLVTCILITTTSLLFFIYDAPFLASELTLVVPIFGVLLFLFTMITLLHTGLTDPGIIPRATSDEAAEIEKQIQIPNASNNPTHRPPPRTKEILVRGFVMKLKYCPTCKIFRPPRASHCSICDNCVDRFDHHCPWVGNCIGRRNYRFFYMFVISLTAMAVYIFIGAVTHIILLSRTTESFTDVISKTPTSFYVCTISLFSTWVILALAGYHTYLVKSNQTTNEDIKGSFVKHPNEKNINPFTLGNFCLNWLHIICGPLPPSLINKRGFIHTISQSMKEPIAQQNTPRNQPPDESENESVIQSEPAQTIPEVETANLSKVVDTDLDLDPVILMGNSIASDLNETTMIQSPLDLDSLTDGTTNTSLGYCDSTADLEIVPII